MSVEINRNPPTFSQPLVDWKREREELAKIIRDTLQLPVGVPQSVVAGRFVYLNRQEHAQFDRSFWLRMRAVVENQPQLKRLVAGNARFQALCEFMVVLDHKSYPEEVLSEGFCRGLAYLDEEPLKPGQVVPTPLGHFVVKAVVGRPDEGLFAYFFMECGRQGDHLCEKRAIVTFRGTHNRACVRRDLQEFPIDRLRAGFEEKKEALLTALQDTLHGHQDCVKIIVTGHSLGGADAQSFTAALAFWLREKKIVLERLQEVRLDAFCAPAISSREQKSFHEAVAEREGDPLVMPQFRLHYPRVATDVVAYQGTQFLGAENCSVQLKNVALTVDFFSTPVRPVQAHVMRLYVLTDKIDHQRYSGLEAVENLARTLVGAALQGIKAVVQGFFLGGSEKNMNLDPPPSSDQWSVIELPDDALERECVRFVTSFIDDEEAAQPPPSLIMRYRSRSLESPPSEERMPLHRTLSDTDLKGRRAPTLEEIRALAAWSEVPVAEPSPLLETENGAQPVKRALWTRIGAAIASVMALIWRGLRALFCCAMNVTA